MLIGVGTIRRFMRHELLIVLYTLCASVLGVIAAMDGFWRHEYYFVVILPISSILIAHGVRQLRMFLNGDSHYD